MAIQSSKSFRIKGVRSEKRVSIVVSRTVFACWRSKFWSTHAVRWMWINLQTTLGTVVAAKEIITAMMNPKDLKEFIHEARMLTQMNHPHCYVC